MKRSGKTLWMIQELERWRKENPGKTALFMCSSEASMSRALTICDSPKPEPQHGGDGSGDGESDGGK